MADQTAAAAKDNAPEKRNGPVVVSVINLKGGVGKTTVTALLARYAIEVLSLRALAVDLDPQANLSQALMSEMEYQKIMGVKKPGGQKHSNPAPGIVELFNGYLQGANAQGKSASLEAVGKTVQRWRYRPGDPYHLIPSRFGFADALIKPIDFRETVLADFINKEMSHKQLVVIDCAPTESILTRAAYHASTHILVPVKTEMYSTIGFPLLLESLSDFQEQHGKTLKGWVVINTGGTLGKPKKTARGAIRNAAREAGWPVLSHEMGNLTGYQKWMIDGATHLGDYWDDFRPIAQEFLGELFPESGQ